MTIDLDADLQNMSRVQLAVALGRLRKLVRDVVTQKGDDLCWRDAYLQLAAELPEKPAVDHTPPTPIFLANCTHFEACMRQGTPYVASDCPLRRADCPGLKVTNATEQAADAGAGAGPADPGQAPP